MLQRPRQNLHVPTLRGYCTRSPNPVVLPRPHQHFDVSFCSSFCIRTRLVHRERKKISRAPKYAHLDTSYQVLTCGGKCTDTRALTAAFDHLAYTNDDPNLFYNYIQ